MKIKGNLSMKVLKGDKIIEYKDHNTLTKLFEHIILNTSIGSLLSSNTGSELGTSYLNFPMRFGSTQGYNMTSADRDDLITIYLLNLTTEEQGQLSKTIKKNPIVGTNMVINDDALIGYATCSYGGTAQKEGVITTPDSAIGMDSNLFPIAFKWTPGKITGTINTIIIGTNVISDPSHSVSLARGLDINNPVINEGNSSGYFLTTGCTTKEGVVLTTNEEILLGNGQAPTKARRVLNLNTGVEMDLETSDPRYNHTLYNKQHAYIGEGRVIVQYDYETAYTYDLTTDSRIGYIGGRGFAIHNNYIYVKNVSGTEMRFSAYDMETLNAASSNDIIITIPDKYKDTMVSYNLSNFGKDKFLLTRQTSNSSAPDLTLDSALVFTDLTNPFGSFVCGYLGQVGSSIVIGDKEFYISNLAQSVYVQNTQGVQVFSIEGKLINCFRTGVKITDLTTDYGQVLTYSTLETPITLTETDGFEITYYFNI